MPCRPAPWCWWPWTGADAAVQARAVVAEQGLEAVVVRLAQVHEDADLAHPAVDGNDGTGRVGHRHRPRLPGRRAVEGCGRVEVDGPVDVAEVLVHVVGAQEEPARQLALGADREDLAARVAELVGVVREEVEVEPVAPELIPVEVRPAGLDHDVARRQLGGRQRPRVEGQGKTGSGQAGRESELAWDRGVGRQTVEAVDEVARDRVGTDLRVVHGVSAADRRPGVAPDASRSRNGARSCWCRRSGSAGHSGGRGRWSGRGACGECPERKQCKATAGARSCR